MIEKFNNNNDNNDDKDVDSDKDKDKDNAHDNDNYDTHTQRTIYERGRDSSYSTSHKHQQPSKKKQHIAFAQFSSVAVNSYNIVSS